MYHASQVVPVSSFRRVKENKCILTLFLFFIFFIIFFHFDSLNWGLDNNKARSPTEASCGLWLLGKQVRSGKALPMVSLLSFGDINK